MKTLTADSAVRTGLNTLDPCQDLRWAMLVERHPEASIFHTPGWLRALQRAYGYEPVVFTTSPPNRPLENGIVFCRVRSRLTGARLVSLPFSDHCGPLTDGPGFTAAVLGELEQELARQKYRYIELRPAASFDACVWQSTGFVPSEEFYLHRLSLEPDLDLLFRNFHRDCIQRKIRRAERVRLTYEAGRSEAVLAKFYRLQLLTRRRHWLPPQPITWFRSLVECLGGQLTIRVLSHEGQPIASILTLRSKTTLVYKYGCSDARFHSLGGMPLLFWKAIQEEKQTGAEEFDLGRSDTDNKGLSDFKEHLGAARSTLVYYRLGRRAASPIASRWQSKLFRRAAAGMPGPVAQFAGNLLYRHLG